MINFVTKRILHKSSMTFKETLSVISGGNLLADDDPEETLHK
uniref:Uncharacterized protein n=1 Tax=Candidatus Nitrotoga fabula TaxID=2182327 RepID=A0A2X0QVP2_9PROT|nr:protein of unknown function [Candidatus Nitrotoga fabula]